MTLTNPVPDCQRILDHCHGSLILLKPQGKTPLDENWVKAPSKINGDGRCYLDLGFNLGYRIASDALVIDVDPRNGGGESFLLLPPEVQALPVTTLTPSGGFHVYTRLPADFDYKTLRSKVVELPGIDFLHHGKQVVLPGSSLNEQLAWRLGPDAVLPPPAAPSSLLELLRRPAPTSRPIVEMESYLSVFELDLILSMIPVNQYRSNDPWLQLAMACHHATDGQGLSAFLSWSLADPMYSDQGEIIARRWESMATGNTPAPVTIRTLLKELAKFAPVPSWLTLRAGIQTSPAEFFKTLDAGQEQAKNAFETLSARIDATTDHLQLLTTVAATVGAESGVTESLREVLLKKIAVKTGTSIAAIRRDLKLFSAPKYQEPLAAPEGGEEEEPLPAGLPDMAQPHTAAAQTALAALSADGTPPAFCFGHWLKWDGSHWAKSGLEVEIKRQVHRALYNQGTHATAAAVRSVVEIMETMMAVTPAAFEPDVEQIAIFSRFNVLRFTKEGWRVESPAAKNRNLMIIGASYDPEAPQPSLWLRFLDQITTSRKARRTIACAIIYAAAQCRPWLRKAIYVYGPKRSGKSTLLDTIQALLGANNCSALNMRQLGGRFGTSSIVGKLANISNETVSRDTLQDDIFKALVSGEAVEVERKHEAQFVVHNTAKLFFAANGFPRVNDESDATTDRLTIISCPWSIPKANGDTLLRVKLARELPGILNWAMRIFEEEYRRDRCISAMEMDEAAELVMSGWKEVNAPALRWVRERTQRQDEALLNIDAAYADYRLWCRENGHKEANKVHFSRQIGQTLERETVNGRIHYAGLSLLPAGTGCFSILN